MPCTDPGVRAIMPRHTETQRTLAQFAARRADEERWEAQMPPSMAGLIEQERLREVREPPAEAAVEVSVQGAPQAEQFPELPREHFEKSVHLIEPSGLVYNGAEAVFRSLAVNPRRRRCGRRHDVGSAHPPGYDVTRMSYPPGRPPADR